MASLIQGQIWNFVNLPVFATLTRPSMSASLRAESCEHVPVAMARRASFCGAHIFLVPVTGAVIRQQLRGHDGSRVSLVCLGFRDSAVAG